MEKAIKKTGILVALIAIALLLPVRAGAGEQFSFEAIWKLVREHAPEIRAASHDFEGAQINEMRMSRHWYPRVFAEGRAFSTNDPALSFMSLLGQRQMGAPDFAPQALNQPAANFYERGTLGVDFPIYEGGAKAAMSEAAQKMMEAKSLELQSSEINQYAGLANAYSALLSLRRQHAELQRLDQNIKAILSKYKIGSKSNPVGYSGLLGLKNLQNRISGILFENNSKIASFRERIRISAENLPDDWNPAEVNSKKFIAENLSVPNSGSQGSETSASAKAARSLATSLGQMKGAERARFLPKVGLFATGDLYSGNRNSATSYTGGIYMQWELFSAQNLGSVNQAEQAAAAAEARADEMSQRGRIARVEAKQAADFLEANLELLNDSAKLLEEQTATASELFKNGSINALQLVEVLARRVDLTLNRTDSELGLVQAHTILLVNSGGIPHEN